MPNNHAIYNWLAILGIGYIRWQNLKKQWQALQISEAEAWIEVLKDSYDFSLPSKIRDGVKKQYRRFGDEGWLEYLQQQHIVPVSSEDEKYPSKLRALSHPPPILYIRSRSEDFFDTLRKPILAVVGTRHPTPSGEQVLKKILTQFLQASEKKVVISSGMMYGIDEVAHKQALGEGSPTVAVVGSGLIWQKQHDSRGLFHSILENEGVLVSQFHPEIAPSKGTFVVRNTTLAGMSDAVLVGEAHVGSGSRHTVAAAARLSKPIWTIPVHSAHATAPAVIELVNTYSAKLLINDQPLKVFFGIKNEVLFFETSQSDPTAQSLLTALQESSMTFEKLVQKTTLHPSKITELLIRLELAATIMRKATDWTLPADNPRLTFFHNTGET